MAEGGGSNENPFSFKKFVKSKHETKIPTTKKTQGKQTSKTSAVNQRNKDIFEDEAPFPEVNKEGKDVMVFLFRCHTKIFEYSALF